MASQKLNIDIVAKDKSRKALTGLKGSLSRIKQSVFNLRNAFIGLGAALVIRNIVNTGKQIENLQVQLKFLFGSAEEGAKAFDEMAKFASKVPFSLEEIQRGSGVLAVVSDDAEELAHLMKITGNVAAVTGLDFKTTAEQIQRSLSAGISAADLFRDKGVKDMLGFKAGATASVEETAAAFNRVFGDGGKFDGATDELAKTFGGTLSMIGDKVFNFKRVLLDAGFFSELKKQFGDLNKFIAANEEEFDAIAKAIGTILTVVVKGFAMAIKGVAKAVGFLRDSYEDLILTLNKIPFVNIGIITKAQREILSNQAKMQKNQLSSLLTQNKINDATKSGNKELEKEKKIIFNIFESHRKLIEAVDDYNLRHRTTAEILRDMNEKTLEDLKDKFLDINRILEFINSGFKNVSQALARAVIYGEQLGETFRKMVQDVAYRLLSALIEWVIRLAAAWVYTKYIKQEEQGITREKRKQLALQMAIVALGGGSGGGNSLFSLFKFQHGGSISKGQPAIVGERGPELFIPNSSGQITQNARGTGGSPVNVNFSITTLDATGFNDMLINNRGTISSIINEAVNERGARSIV